MLQGNGRKHNPPPQQYDAVLKPMSHLFDCQHAGFSIYSTDISRITRHRLHCIIRLVQTEYAPYSTRWLKVLSSNCWTKIWLFASIIAVIIRVIYHNVLWKAIDWNSNSRSWFVFRLALIRILALAINLLPNFLNYFIIPSVFTYNKIRPPR